MKKEQILAHLPTILAFWEKRKKAKQNQLPKHLRPPSTLPIWVQITLNVGVVVILWNLIMDRDEYVTEAGPAIVMVICFLLLIYTMINAFRLKRFFFKIRGQRLTKINLVLMGLAFLFWAATIVTYLP